MKKLMLIMLITFLFVSIASAEDLKLCEEPLTHYEDCLMITPVLSCTGVYDYVIINGTNSTIIEGNLTEYEAETYCFNFSMPRGEYIIELCDGTTREIIVGGKEKMLATTIGIAAFIFLLFFVASKINVKDGNWWLKGAQVLLVITGLIFMLLIPASYIFADFEFKFWFYVMWQLRVYAGYCLIGLLIFAFEKFDIKRRLRL